MQTSIKIGSNTQMPIIGLGTWNASDPEFELAVTLALETGYRHIDTAFSYGNENAVGRVLQRWFATGGKREDIFITTKLPQYGMRPEEVSKFVEASLNRLQLDYIDLYLIHFPAGVFCDIETLTPLRDDNGDMKFDYGTNLHAIWKAMEDEVEKGKLKNIGLSNFNATQTESVYNLAKIKPSVIQIELHAYFQQKKLRELCDTLGIAVTAYSPLGSRGAQNYFDKRNYKLENFPDLLNIPVVLELAKKYQKTPAQILLRHLVQQSIIVIPKSGNPQRIKENFEIFDFQLESSDMDHLNVLDRDENGRIFDFLFFKGVEKHPCYPIKLIKDFKF